MAPILLGLGAAEVGGALAGAAGVKPLARAHFEPDDGDMPEWAVELREIIDGDDLGERHRQDG